MTWIEKWQYHSKQPAFRSILKYNGLWLVMYLLRIGALFSWFYWIATTFRYVYQVGYQAAVTGKESIVIGNVPDIMMINSVAVFLVVIFVLLCISAVFAYPLGKGVLLGVTISIIGPLTILSLSISLLSRRWLELALFLITLLVLQGTIYGMKRYRLAIHRRSHANSKKTMFYVTHQLDHVLEQEDRLFPLTAAWAPYMKEEASCMTIGGKAPILPNIPVKESAKRQIYWKKTYSYTTLTDHLQLTTSIILLSEMDYLKFVGECLEANRPVVHLGEHVFGVVLEEGGTEADKLEDKAYVSRG
ncbi:hypothetical protein HB847_15790 [Listeria booriae]|uniref:Uncharacterized protein n=1 Tax=Listeria booriae TaxID=1552123 RepID=A0A841YA66_9LIST|nr:hypothetical protein [Listeria booriae]MBC1373814.1 hypothetical protein [Listeria booriae]